jgi:hypothetical protein
VTDALPSVQAGLPAKPSEFVAAAGVGIAPDVAKRVEEAKALPTSISAAMDSLAASVTRMKEAMSKNGGIITDAINAATGIVNQITSTIERQAQEARPGHGRLPSSSRD